MASSVEEAAHHQTVFRAVNENIAKLTGLVSDMSYSLFICECSDTNCAESLEISVAEYEAVRTDGTHFVVMPGHELEGIERVVDGNGRYLVVEKLGRAAQVAAAADPRHS